MKINDNGVIRDMTPEEIREMEEAMQNLPKPEPDPRDVRMDEIEMALMELAAMQGGAENG